MSEGGFTSELVDDADTAGGSENSHLSSLRNAWGDVGVLLVGYLVPSKGSSDISRKEAQVEKDHYPKECLSCLSHYQVLISPVNNP